MTEKSKKYLSYLSNVLIAINLLTMDFFTNAYCLLADN